ncbi:MAG: hypothetical protein KTR32_43760 [Granulosicoccus sp.]|nr:hypothetical protein [Granulosicoccus sp.]
MDLVKGYKFFSPDECEKMRAYCDKKERKLETLLKKQASAPVTEGKASIPLTQRHHYLYNFFAENQKYQPRLIKCVLELVPHLEFPIAVQSWVNIYRNGEGIKWHTHGGKNGYSYSANIFLGGHTTPGIYYSVDPENIFNVENEIGSMHLFPHSLNHMVPESENQAKRYTVGITIHGYQALDKTLVQGVAINNEYQETIFLNDPR